MAIDLEEPELVPGLDAWVPPREHVGCPELRGFRFSYQGGVEEALHAMLAAWEAAGGMGDFRVEHAARAWRLIPTTRHDASGGDAPWRPILDCEITLARTEGTPRQIWEAAGDAIRTQCAGAGSLTVGHGASRKDPEPVVDWVEPDLSPYIRPDPDHPGQTFEDHDAIRAAEAAARPVVPPPPPPLRIEPGPHPARDVLDAVTLAADDGGWWLIQLHEGWFLSALEIELQREWEYNETPIFDAPPPRRPLPPLHR